MPRTRFENEDVRITDLVAPEHPVLSGFRFVNCHLFGPAVVFPSPPAFVGCTFEAPGNDFSTMFWEVETGPGRQIVGAIALHDCTFEGCQFSGIGIAGPASLREQFLNDVG